MSNLTLNVFSNLAGAGWLAVAQLVFVPIYLRLLGIEGYALIGFFVTLQGALKVLELGLTPTVNRELARYSVRPELATDARDFARTFEAISWSVAIVIATMIWSAAPAISTRWLEADEIRAGTVLNAVRAMGLVVALQWPLSFYQGGLLGLQRQPLLNVVKVAMVTVGGLVGVAVLLLIAPSVTIFFWSQFAVTIIHVGMMRATLWRSLPDSPAPPRITPARFRSAYRFAAGMTGIMACSVVVTQADKIVLSRMVSLETFGYYSIATVVGSALAAMNAPVFNAMFPRFTALVEAGDRASSRRLFHLASQCVAVVTVPAAIVIAAFAFEILWAWTGDQTVATNAAPFVSILILGSGAASLMNLPYALQLAHAWTRIAFVLNLIFAVAIVPALLVAVSLYGAIGAAWVCLVINTVYVIVGVELTHRRLIDTSGWQWFVNLAAVAGVAIAVIAPWRLVLAAPLTRSSVFLAIIGAGLSSTLAAGLVSPDCRRFALSLLAGHTQGR